MVGFHCITATLLLHQRPPQLRTEAVFHIATLHHAGTKLCNAMSPLRVGTVILNLTKANIVMGESRSGVSVAKFVHNHCQQIFSVAGPTAPKLHTAKPMKRMICTASHHFELRTGGQVGCVESVSRHGVCIAGMVNTAYVRRSLLCCWFLPGVIFATLSRILRAAGQR